MDDPATIEDSLEQHIADSLPDVDSHYTDSPVHSADIVLAEGSVVTSGEDGHLSTSASDVLDQINAVTAAVVKSPSNDLSDILHQTTAELEPMSTVDMATVEKMTNAFLAHSLPKLESCRSELDELKRNQRILIETVQQEKAKFDECQAFRQLGDTMVTAKQYHNKLLNIKKEMSNLHDRSAKLKKRALKLQQQKQKEELQRAHQQDKQMERERALMAKPAKQSPKDKSKDKSKS